MFMYFLLPHWVPATWRGLQPIQHPLYHGGASQNRTAAQTVHRIPAQCTAVRREQIGRGKSCPPCQGFCGQLQAGHNGTAQKGTGLIQYGKG